MKILIGLATTNKAYLSSDGKTIVRSGPDKRFLENLPLFLRDCALHFPEIQMDTMWVWNKPLVEAQNDFAERVLDMNYDYLLTIEDDHWGFKVEMLEACFEAEAHVCGIPYRSRHFPFEVVPMKYQNTDKNGVKRFSGMNSKELKGYHEADLIGFGFTLIKAEVFRILDRPFFRTNIEYYKGVGPHATDIDFCDRLISKGIHPVGCFDHRVNHRDIEEDRYAELIVAGVLTQHSMFTSIENIGRYKKVQNSFNINKEENNKLRGK